MGWSGGLIEKVMFGQRPEGDGGVSWADFWGNRLPEWWKGGRNSQSKALKRTMPGTFKEEQASTVTMGEDR